MKEHNFEMNNERLSFSFRSREGKRVCDNVVYFLESDSEPSTLKRESLQKTCLVINYIRVNSLQDFFLSTERTSKQK